MKTQLSKKKTIYLCSPKLLHGSVVGFVAAVYDATET